MPDKPPTTPTWAEVKREIEFHIAELEVVGNTQCEVETEKEITEILSDIQELINSFEAGGHVVRLTGEEIRVIIDWFCRADYTTMYFTDEEFILMNKLRALLGDAGREG